MSFLYLYFTGVSQNYAVLHGGICDVLIAMTAIPLSQYIKTHDGLGEECRGLVMIWNFLWTSGRLLYDIDPFRR